MRTKLALLAIAFLAFVGCGSNRTAVQESNYLLNAEDFDLGTVVAMIRDGQVGDASTLQARINDPSAGINNVDTDKDGNVDFVRVQETVNGATRRYEFYAHPSGNANGEPTVVATAEFSPETSGGYAVNAGYPDYVYGHDAHYYHHVFHDVAFLTWAYGVHPVYAFPYATYHYVPYRLHAPAVLISTRNAYRTTYRVGTIAATVRPANGGFLRAGTYRVPTAYRSRMVRAPSDSISAARTGRVTPFTSAAAGVNSRRATGFGSYASPRPAVVRTTSTSTASSPSRFSTGRVSGYGRPAFSGRSRSRR